MVSNNQKIPKALKSGVGSNFVIPIAIVLIGALIIFGVTKMLDTERSYRDLVYELHSKTFGNRWIAAFELSKVISSKSIPESDVPWLIENLDELYESATDVRTKNFIIVALGALRDPLSLKTLKMGLVSNEATTIFHSLVSLAALPKGFSFDWKLVESFLGSSDEGLKQAAILTLSTHQVSDSEQKIINLLNDSSTSIRYASATGLIYFKNTAGLNILKEIFLLQYDSRKKNLFNLKNIFGLKINVLNALRKMNWKILNSDIEQMIEKESDLKLIAAAKEILNELKN